MNLSVLKRRALWTFVAAVVATGSYLAHTAWQTQRGEAALKTTALELLPLERALALAKAQGQPSAGELLGDLAPDVTRAVRRGVHEHLRQAGDHDAGYVLSRIDYESPETRASIQRDAVLEFPTVLVLSAEGQLVRRVPISFDPATLAATLRG